MRKGQPVGRAIVKAAAVAFCLSTVSAGDCLASCTCDLPTVAQALQASAAVFTGTVISVKGEPGHTSKDRSGHLSKGPDWYKHRVLVNRSWKGPAAGRVETVYTNTDGCLFAFLKGSVAIIYATRIEEDQHRGALYVYGCDRSSASPEQVAADSDSLGPPASMTK